MNAIVVAPTMDMGGSQPRLCHAVVKRPGPAVRDTILRDPTHVAAFTTEN